MNTFSSDTLVTALGAAAFGFVLGVILAGSALEEGGRSVVSVVSDYVLTTDRR
jgi:hypothetical protein